MDALCGICPREEEEEETELEVLFGTWRCVDPWLLKELTRSRGLAKSVFITESLVSF